MGKSIHWGRRTADFDRDVVVFLIGARINRWWRVGSWWPVFKAFPAMLRELEAKPELGLLGYEQWVGRTTIAVQYWRSLEHLLAYARARDAVHLPAWRDFNRRARTRGGDVGLWHEIYQVPEAGAKSMYVDMPAFGIGALAGTTDAHPVSAVDAA